MKKLLSALLLGSIALTACATPNSYNDDDNYRTDRTDRYEQRYDRHDDRYDDYRYRDGKYYDDDYIEYKIYSDPSFEQKRAQVMRILEQRGYIVHEIEADDHIGRPVLKAEGFKNGHEYDIIFSCPDLKIISEHIDY